MNTGPVKVPQPPAKPAAQQAEEREKHSQRADAMYCAGAVLVTAGCLMHSIHDGLIAGGVFLLLLPVLELLGSFIRGLRTKR